MTLRFRVGKLIRDGLPAMMEAQGLRIFTRRLDDAELARELQAKLVEEAHEVEAARSRSELLEELADVAEVMRALAKAQGITLEDIEAARLAKHAARGGFEARVYNAAVEGEVENPAVAYYLARPEQYPQDP